MSSSPTETSATIDVTLPQMGVSVAEGTVIAWRKRVGEQVAAEETVCEITTDKIDVEVPAPVAGVLSEILVEEEMTVPVGTVIARIQALAPTGIAGSGEAHSGQASTPEVHGPGSATSAQAPAREPAAPSPAPSAPPSAPVRNGHTPRESEPEPSSRNGATGQSDGAVEPATRKGSAGRDEHARREHAHYSPVVRRIAKREGVDLGLVHGTGRGGRVRKQDVIAFLGERQQEERPLHIESPYREPEPAMPGEQPERLSRMRRSIAEHMRRSLDTAAHCTSLIEADMSAVQAAREALGLTYLPFVARCVIDALREHPDLNATLDGESLTRHRAVNLGIATSLDRDGLVVPVIHDAQELSHEGLARRIAELAERARGGSLDPDDVRGGTFTITNPGGYGTLASTPIINQPQVAILDLEAVVKRPVVVTDDAGRDAIAIRPMAYLCLSWDHRALDGAIAAQFLATLRRRIECWGM